MDQPKRSDLPPWRAAAVRSPLQDAIGEVDQDELLPEILQDLLDRLKSAPTAGAGRR